MPHGSTRPVNFYSGNLQLTEKPLRGGLSARVVERPTFQLGDGIAAQHLGDESWGILGQSLRI